jgi:uncharacterized damage-inducible protein DinB
MVAELGCRMDDEQIYLVADQPGFTPHIGRLVSMMNYARHTTLDAVRDLSVAQLDERPNGFGNSIAMLLEHFAGVEVVYQIITFEGREPADAELTHWLPGLDLGDKGESIRGKPLEHYLEQLAQVRAKTLAEFAKRDDDWLHLEFPWWDNKPGNNYFCWFHVFEDEINHRGQIRLIRKNLTSR